MLDVTRLTGLVSGEVRSVSEVTALRQLTSPTGERRHSGSEVTGNITRLTSSSEPYSGGMNDILETLRF